MLFIILELIALKRNKKPLVVVNSPTVIEFLEFHNVKLDVRAADVVVRNCKFIEG